MNDDLISDRKQFITATITRQTTGLRVGWHGLRQDASDLRQDVGGSCQDVGKDSEIAIWPLR